MSQSNLFDWIESQDEESYFNGKMITLYILCFVIGLGSLEYYFSI